jgi:hypothetical protein
LWIGDRALQWIGEHDRVEPDLVVCAITSQISLPLTAAEFLVPTQELSTWGLPKPSKAKLAKLFTVHPSLIRQKIGSVPCRTLERLLEQARALFELHSPFPIVAGGWAFLPVQMDPHEQGGQECPPYRIEPSSRLNHEKATFIPLDR